MKKQIREVLSKYRGNQGYTMEHAESELLNLFSVVQQSEQLCQYEPDNTTAMNCKHCGDPKWVHKCCSLVFTNVYKKGGNNNKDMTREEFIEKAKELAIDFWTMNLRDGTYESKFTELLNEYEGFDTSTWSEKE